MKTPLHYAAKEKGECGNLLRKLLSYGGDLYQKDNNGRTPINILQTEDKSFYSCIVRDHLCTSKCLVVYAVPIKSLYPFVRCHTW